MTLNKDGLEAAKDALWDGGNGIPFNKVDRYAKAAITAYLAALPAPDGLVEKLNRGVLHKAWMGCDLGEVVTGGADVGAANALMSEAAIVIQTQAEKIDRLWGAILNERQATARAVSRAEAAEQQVRDMREGLEPFARVGDIFELRAGNRPNSDDDPVTEWEDHRVGARRLTVGDFRRARLLLKEGGE